MAGQHPIGWILAVVGLAAGAATLLGGFLALRLSSRIHLVLGFSAGAVIGVALLDLLPEAMQLGRADAAAPLLGIAASRLIVLPPAALGLAVALFGGFFLYIGASELLPESHHRHPRAWTTAATVLGVAMIWLVVRVAGQ